MEEDDFIDNGIPIFLFVILYLLLSRVWELGFWNTLWVTLVIYYIGYLTYNFLCE